MLDIKKVESINEVYVSGILNELEISEHSSANGDFISGVARIRVDQEVNGQSVENIIPIRMFSARTKKDGSPNKNYDRIKGYRDSLIALAAAEDPSQASRITVSGNAANITENSYYTPDGRLVQSFQINTNFLNAKRDTDAEKATFAFSGVVGKMKEETKDDVETGRLIVSFIVVGYNGRANVIELVADGAAKTFIENNWNEGDTVKVNGIINMTYTVKKYYEEQGFGEPIERQRTESRRELLITGGSQSGLEESFSYDADDIKAALAERATRLKEQEQKSKEKKSTTSTASTGKVNFGF